MAAPSRTAATYIIPLALFGLFVRSSCSGPALCRQGIGSVGHWRGGLHVGSPAACIGMPFQSGLSAPWLPSGMGGIRYTVGPAKHPTKRFIVGVHAWQGQHANEPEENGRNPPASGLSTVTGIDGRGCEVATQGTEKGPEPQPDGSEVGGECDVSELEAMARTYGRRHLKKQCTIGRTRRDERTESTGKRTCNRPLRANGCRRSVCRCILSFASPFCSQEVLQRPVLLTGCIFPSSICRACRRSGSLR